jgi:prophage tail gpP-like protein
VVAVGNAEVCEVRTGHSTQLDGIIGDLSALVEAQASDVSVGHDETLNCSICEPEAAAKIYCLQPAAMVGECLGAQVRQAVTACQADAGQSRETLAYNRDANVGHVYTPIEVQYTQVL